MKTRWQWHGRTDAPVRISKWLAEHTGLSHVAVKRLMAYGAVWTEQAGRRERLRRADRVLPVGTPVWLYHDAALLQREVPQAVCLHQEKRFSVWFKPAGLLTQGNQWGDHASLLRQAEKGLKRPVWLIHRLDLETAGLVVLAHHQQVAGWLSQQFQQRKVEKRYRTWVKGQVLQDGHWSTPLDGRTAHTRYAVLAHRQTPMPMTLLDIHPETGRLHQIRRHAALAGHHIVGDPRYGQGDDPYPLQLVACELALRLEPGRSPCRFVLPDEQWQTIEFISSEER